MPCVVCKSGDAPYKCSSCGNAVCKNHARNVDNKAMCLNCIANAQKKPESGFRSAFLYALFLFIAAAVVYFLGDWFITNSLAGSGLPGIAVGAVAGFRSLGMLIVIALGAIAAVLFILSRLFK